MNREALGLKASLRLERKLAMYFESFEALLAMGGHGRYVWSAYGIAIAVLLWNQLVLKLSKKRYQKILRLLTNLCLMAVLRV